MKQNKKKNNANIVLPIIIGLTCVTGVGIGFSSWVISSQKVSDTYTINVNTADIVDKRISVATVSEGADLSLCFGPAKDDSEGPITSDGTNVEDLSFTVKFTVTENGTDALKNFSKFTLEFVNPFKDTDNASQSWFTLPSAVDITVTDGALQEVTDKVTVSSDSTTKTTTVTYTDSFAWGSTFSSQNPSTYATDDNFGTVKTAIEAMNTALNGKSFTLNLTSFLVTSA